MKDYKVTIIETSKRTVTVEAESLDDAIQAVSDGWRNGEYVLDYCDFSDVAFENGEPYVELSYREMSDVFIHANKIGHKPVRGYIVFDQSGFDKPYSEESRTYCISSDNKAYRPNMGGYSVYGSCLDGTDICIRMDGFIRGPQALKIERCYMERDTYNELLSQPVHSDVQRDGR